MSEEHKCHCEDHHCCGEDCCHEGDGHGCSCGCGEHSHEGHGCSCGCGEHAHGEQSGRKPHIATPSFQAQDPDKGVSLGEEVEQEVSEVMRKRYARFLAEDESFAVKTEVCHRFGLVSAVLSSKSRATHASVEVSVECEPNKIDNPIEAYQKALDVMDLVWLDYFDSDRISHYLPIWQGYELDSMEVNVRFDHCSPALDDEASEFLKAHGFRENGLTDADYADDEEDIEP